MRVYYFDLAKMSRNFLVLALLVATTLLFSMIVRQNIPSTAGAAGEAITRVQTKENVIALTFDIKPGTEIAPVIRSLEEQQAKATFFIDTAWTQENEKPIRHISLNGHELGILVNTKGKDNINYSEYVGETRELFSQLTGSSPWLVRLSSTKQGTDEAETLYSLGYKIISSTKTIQDTTDRSIKQLQPGIILHIPHHEESHQTQEIINKVVSTAKEEHYRLVTLSELLSYGPGITN